MCRLPNICQFFTPLCYPTFFQNHSSVSPYGAFSSATIESDLELFEKSYVITFSSFGFMIIPKPKYFSKNARNLSMIPCFFPARFPPPNRLTGGMISSTAVPFVLSTPASKLSSMNLRVASGFRLSALISFSRSSSFCFVIFQQDNAVRICIAKQGNRFVNLILQIPEAHNIPIILHRVQNPVRP